MPDLTVEHPEKDVWHCFYCLQKDAQIARLELEIEEANNSRDSYAGMHAKEALRAAALQIKVAEKEKIFDTALTDNYIDNLEKTTRANDKATIIKSSILNVVLVELIQARERLQEYRMEDLSERMT